MTTSQVVINAPCTNEPQWGTSVYELQQLPTNSIILFIWCLCRVCACACIHAHVALVVVFVVPAAHFACARRHLRCGQVDVLLQEFTAASEAAELDGALPTVVICDGATQVRQTSK